MSSALATASLRRSLGVGRSTVPRLLVAKRRPPSTLTLRFDELFDTTRRVPVDHQTRYLSSSTSSSPSLNVAQSSSVATTPDGSSSVPTHPIDFDVASKIEGNESQIVTINLEPGQILRAESGAMMYMTDGVEMNTTTGGGMSAGFQRMLTVRITPGMCAYTVRSLTSS